MGRTGDETMATATTTAPATPADRTRPALLARLRERIGEVASEYLAGAIGGEEYRARTALLLDQADAVARLDG